MTEALPGRFCWHELTSPDADASRAFYTDLFGWTVNEMDMGEAGVYPMFMSGENGIGGIEAPKDDSPPHWLPYLTADDIDATVERASTHGGTVVTPKTEIPNVGWFAVLEDPAGARFALYEGTKPDVEPDGPPPIGTICWNELLTTDPDACRAFYGEVFGYSHSEMDMGPMGKYTMFQRGECQGIGMMKMPPEAPGRSHWLAYVHVDDVDSCAKRVAGLGGTVCVQPQDIPGIGRFAVAIDTLGAEFAIFKG